MAFLKSGVNLDTLFESRLTAAISPVYFIDGSDLSQKYERLSNGTQISENTGFIYSGSDLKLYFAAKGSVTGYLYDLGITYWRDHFYWAFDGKTYYWQQDATYVLYGNSAVYSGTWANLNLTASGYLYTRGGTFGSPLYATETAGVERYEYYSVSKTASVPTITSFTANTPVSTSGYQIVLYPVFSGGTGVIGTTGINSTDITASATNNGYHYAYPTSDTTYTLTVGGSVTSTASVTVFAAPTTTGLSYTKLNLNLGDASNNSTVLYPSFTAPGNSTYPGYGTLTDVGTVSNGGSYTVSPTTTTTYYLSATNGAGASVSTANRTITVWDIPSAISLTGSPSTIVRFDSSTLTASWSGTNCTGSINQSVGAVTNGGTKVVSPTINTTYTLTVSNGNPDFPYSNSASKTIIVTTSCGAYCRLDGACCPAPDVPILMSDHTLKLAGDLVIGDKVISWNEKLNTFEIEAVSNIKVADNHRYKLHLSDGQTPSFSEHHRLLTIGGIWKEVQDLQPNDEMCNFTAVLKVEDEGIGPVIQITIDNTHTYISAGIISHNLKGLD